MTIQLIKNGEVILFDSEDWKLIHGYRWRVDSQGYAVYIVYDNGVKIEHLKMHRLILGLTDPAVLGDHINHKRSDNRRCNLRPTNPAGNARNTSPTGRCKYLGVRYKTFRPYQKKEKFIASICVNRKRIYLGSFDLAEDAALAYNTAATKYFGEFASLNVI